MKSLSSKEEIESALASHLVSPFRLKEKRSTEVMSSGIAEVDSITGGIPRGAITEVLGAASSGRTSLLHSTLAEATAHQEHCAIVDVSDTFDPSSAATAGVDLDQLLWIRCGGNIDHALKATDLLLQGGGFGLAVLDLGDVPAKALRHIPTSYWFRFRRSVENTPTALLAIAREPVVRSCALVSLELIREDIAWAMPTGSASSCLLQGLRLRVERRKPIRVSQSRACFEARASYENARSQKGSGPHRKRRRT